MEEQNVVVVTGAGNGIGESCAKAFAAQGDAVVALDVLGARAAAVVDEIRTAGGEAMSAIADVRVSSELDQAVASCMKQYGRVDALVNSAGVGLVGDFLDFTEQAWHTTLDVNLTGAYLAARHVVPRMLEGRRGGAIISIASVQAFWSQRGAGAYSASKGGLVAFTRALALDLAPHGIRANAVAPGSVRTPMLIKAAQEAAPDDPQRALAAWGAAHPIGRLIEPEEIADAVVFLAGPRASAVTGATLLIDGGLSAGDYHWAD